MIFLDNYVVSLLFVGAPEDLETPWLFINFLLIHKPITIYNNSNEDILGYKILSSSLRAARSASCTLRVGGLRVYL